ncbi:class I SAM-dependent methyltransferase [Pelomonas sp. KK5]|uniref:class I SAM-dependent methyltransferase n=1 Tax=Pelomonas sp. KK5 TaxID=1855730 RepID=UPI00097CB37C|nr:class I SAM-dependent methyltransferase [Pelomonas sp. KK5]
MTDDDKSTEIRFDDGAGYEEMMGRWSALVGERFLDWIGVPDGSRWLDVGCGNGAFTQLVVERCHPLRVQAFDPAPAQIAYARTRLPAASAGLVDWAEGDAMQLPVADGAADAAVMALVLFFVPQPARGVVEMVRALRPGGIAAAYHWDVLNGGFPFAPIGAEALKMGVPRRLPPSVEASTIEASTRLWTEAGLRDVRTTQFTVERTFSSFDAYWESTAQSNTTRPMYETLTAEQLAQLKINVRRRVGAADGPVTLSARANAICGVRP